MHSRTLKIDVGSKKLIPLLSKATFKGCHGGRGGTKSYFFADMHIARALSQPGYRALCLREVQRSIKESSKRLLEQRIQHHGLGSSFDVMDAEIRTPGGGQLVFHGLQNHTAESVKSFEGFDVADIEEGQTIKQRSLDLLIPTIIRKPGAEIWARWNPRHDTDPIDKLFRGPKAPPGSVCVEVGWQDNPWLSNEMRRQIEADYENDPEKAMHIWGGGYEIITEGSYYAKQIAQADRDGRIGHFPYDPDLPVITGWDIGVDDYTAVWFMQENGREVRAIDYYECSGEGAQHVADVILSKPYKYKAHYLPHDVRNREWGSGAKKREDTLRDLGITPVRVGARLGPVERINATRALLPIVSFDREKAWLGIKRLRNYCRKFNESTQSYLGPLHDDSSHGSDAFGEFALNCSIRPTLANTTKSDEFKDYTPEHQSESSTSWL
ncbi:MAG: phage terminase large subunit [Colwellia sp.]|nr:phage terminase large subunit [Colwellia sp.]